MYRKSLTFLIWGVVSIGLLNAQSGKPLRFEVASIRPAEDSGRGGMEMLPGGGLRMNGVTLYGLIGLAYDIRSELISGGPKWAQTEAFAILAKSERDDADATVTPGAMNTPTAFDQLRERLRTLLEERFNLAVRTVGQESSGFMLVPAKGGTKLTATTTPLPPGTMRSSGAITGRSGTMTMLATVLSGYLGRPVVDRTGLTGNYDYKLHYSEDLGPGGSKVDVPGPSIFTALQEQLGLKLESGRVTVNSIVIVRADRPTLH
jgi:bla regulator protein blaR1